MTGVIVLLANRFSNVLCSYVVFLKPLIFLELCPKVGAYTAYCASINVRIIGAGRSPPSHAGIISMVNRQAELAQPPGAIARWLSSFGRTARITSEHAGAIGSLTWQVGRAILRGKVQYRETLNQCYIMGVQSLPIVFVTASLAGIVTSHQGGHQSVSSSPGIC